MPKKLKFWFEFASPYSYLSAMRIEQMAASRQVEIEWCPFLLGVIFKQDLGYADSPFNKHPKKYTYLWRDLERLCQERHLPAITIPDPFPQNAMVAARVACCLKETPQISAFIKAIYCAEFQQGRAIDLALLEDVLKDLDLDVDATLDAANHPDTKMKLRSLTNEAHELGLFGAPTFTTEKGELFWGDDRLERALEWAAKGK